MISAGAIIILLLKSIFWSARPEKGSRTRSNLYSRAQISLVWPMICRCREPLANPRQRQRNPDQSLQKLNLSTRLPPPILLAWDLTATWYIAGPKTQACPIIHCLSLRKKFLNNTPAAPTTKLQRKLWFKCKRRRRKGPIAVINPRNFSTTSAITRFWSPIQRDWSRLAFLCCGMSRFAFPLYILLL